jgi:type IV secretory pathway VirB4 component
MPTTSTQSFVPIKEIRDGVIVLKDGSLRAVLMVSSLNFALKSAEEQEAIIFQYQNFLNSLDFSVQFFIQSRRLNIEPYLDVLKERQRVETNDLLKIQETEYIEFVKNFVESTGIVSKMFYVVVGFTPSILPQSGGTISGVFDSLFGRRKSSSASGKSASKGSGAHFEEHKLQLFQRADAVLQGINRMGVRAVPLNTEELIELFFGLYNPGESEKGKAPELNK